MSDYVWFNEFSENFMKEDYLQGKTIDERVSEIALNMEVILDNPGIGDKFKEYMKKGWYSLSTPMWTNFGNRRGLPISCFGSYIEDTLSSIFSTASEVAMMTKAGGGTSATFSNLRHRGAPITGNGNGSGAVHFMQLFDSTVNLVSQGSTRRGSFAAYLSIDHPDIKEFLTLRSEGSVIQDMSFGVTITDEWMNSMIQGDSEKRKLWAKILESRTNKGYPYIVFIDNMNNGAPEVYRDKGMKITHSNLCVSGDTKILTDEGYVEISSLVDEHVQVWNGNEWSEVIVSKTGTNKQLVEVNLSSGQSLKCTPYHKFYVKDEYHSKPRMVCASELTSGMKLIKFDLPVVKGTELLDKPYTNGFFTGDGCHSRNQNIIYLYHDKKNLKSMIEFECGSLSWTENQENNRIQTKVNGLQNKFFIPSSKYTIHSRLTWLAGLFDADGTVCNNQGSQTLQLASVNLNFLQSLQLMLQELGVLSKISVMREEGFNNLPLNDGSGNNKEYFCQTCYRIIINGNSLYHLYQLGFRTNRLNWSEKKPDRECSHFISVNSVVDVDGLHDTFCFNEPIRHMGMFNGVLTGNCSEIALPDNKDESFVCNLSSMNLLHYDEWKDTDAVEVLVNLLDAAMTEFIDKTSTEPYMDRANRFALRHRAIGVGVLGWHSYLQSKMISFESEEARMINREIFARMKEQAYAASRRMANEYGTSLYMQDYDRRHTTLLAIAPTKSSSFILGQVSNGIEPHKANYYVKDLAKGSFSIKNQQLEALLESKGKNTTEVWRSILENRGSVSNLDFLTEHEKSVFKTFREISSQAIIDQAAERQKFIDQAQSINIMFDPYVTKAKDISQLYIDAWKKGVKSLYYQFNVNAAQELSRNIDAAACASCEL